MDKNLNEYCYRNALFDLKNLKLDEIIIDLTRRINALNISAVEFVDLIYILPSNISTDITIILEHDFNIDREFNRMVEILIENRYKEQFIRDVDLGRINTRLNLHKNPKKRMIDKSEIIAILQAFGEFSNIPKHEYRTDNEYVNRALEIYWWFNKNTVDKKVHNTWSAIQDEVINNFKVRVEELENKYAL